MLVTWPDLLYFVSTVTEDQPSLTADLSESDVKVVNSKYLTMSNM